MDGVRRGEQHGRNLLEEAVVLVVQVLDLQKTECELDEQKLGQAMVADCDRPAALNYDLMRKRGIAASYAYRERFIIEKYDLDGPDSEFNYPGVIDLDDQEFHEVNIESDGRPENLARQVEG